MADEIIAQISNFKKLERDKGIEKVKLVLETNPLEIELVYKLETFVLESLKKRERWETIHGCLMAACLLVECNHEAFTGVLLDLVPEFLEDKEPRVRQTAGELMGKLCHFQGPNIYEKYRSTILSGIRRNFERDDVVLASDESKVLKEKLSGSEALPSDPSRVFHESAGWKGLESYMTALQCAVEGCGIGFEPYINQELLDLLFKALKHPNRFVRECGFKVLAVIVISVPMSAEPSDVMKQYWPPLAQHLADGLADNWSQVRMSASIAVRQFFTHLKKSDNLEDFFPHLLPPMCLNRYYVAEGVRLYSQDTWRQVMGEKGIAFVEKYINEVVVHYINQSRADNHAVREAACFCIAELGQKVSQDVLCPLVPRLIPVLLECFRDDSWPVRDAACLACGNFVACFPKECKVFLKELLELFFRNLEDGIPSVRQGGAVALGKVVEVYGQEVLDSITMEIQQRLSLVESQPSDSNLSHPNIDPSPAVFGVVKRVRDNDPEVHSNQTMYSCGSLAPKMGRGGGCMDHGFQRASQPWEKAEGAVHLVGELSLVKLAHPAVEQLLPLVAQATRHKHYVHHFNFLEAVMRQLPRVAKNLGKRVFKKYIESYFDAIFYSLDSKNALLQSAVTECLQQLTILLGKMIMRGRIEQYNTKYLALFDNLLIQ